VRLYATFVFTKAQKVTHTPDLAYIGPSLSNAKAAATNQTADGSHSEAVIMSSTHPNRTLKRNLSGA
jgi:hypothetical protein